MTKGHGRGIWLVCLFLLPIFLPLASATGGGLLLDGDSLNIAGDQEIGVGDVNVSFDIIAHDSSSNGFLEITFTAENGAILASDNRSINLQAGESSTEFFNISSVPIGTHIFLIELTGGVGTPFQNNFASIQFFIQKLSPAAPSIEPSVDWSVTPVNAETGEGSGNASLRDGDQAWVVVEVSNAGDVNWSGFAIFDFATDYESTPISIPGLSTIAVNFSIFGLTEGNSNWYFDLVLTDDASANAVVSESLLVNIGPPPLPRPILSMTPGTSSPTLSETINWTISIENQGESNFSGSISCDFPIGVEIVNQTLLVPTNGNQSWNTSIDVRPGVLECQIMTNDRIHLDSIVTESFAYDMSAGHLMPAGSEGLIVTGGPFHVGDSIPMAILIHNGGDLAGIGTLEVREGDSDGNNMGAWTSMESRTLEVGSSLELGADYLATSYGERKIEWRVVSSDSLVSEDCAGHISLAVQPSQSLQIEIISWVWTLESGLDVEVTTSLSSGEDRLVLLEIGTSGSSGDETQISIEIYLTPGQRTLSYNLGHPSASSLAWVEMTPLSWASSTTAEDLVNLIRPNPQISATIDSVSPNPPVPDGPATLTYTLTNTGGGDTLAGTLMLIDTKHDGEILWTESIEPVQSGVSQTGTISLQNWPSYSAVDLNLIWQTDQGDAVGANSFLSKETESGEDKYTIDWMSIVYGGLAGLLIGLVTRTVMRARAGEPLISSKSQSKKPKSEAAKTVEEKVEVACPSCDQKLRVPSTYSGVAKCPACAQTFPVESAENEESIEDEDVEEIIDEITQNEDVDEVDEVDAEPEPVQSEMSSSSDNDVILCPDCNQKLKVPYERRPVKARCPACKCQFRALKE